MKRHGHLSPKLADLMQRGALKRFEAVGILECIWNFTATQAPRGDIGKWSDQQIAAAIDWDDAPDFLVDMLVLTGWLDRDEEHRLLVHDWPVHADQHVKRSQIIKTEGFIFRAQKEQSDSNSLTEIPTGVQIASSPEPEPEPEPVLTEGNERKLPFEQIEEAWPDIQAAAAQYGKRWRVLSMGRKRVIKARLEEHSYNPSILAKAVHGYVRLRRKEGDDTFDWDKYLTPEVIYSAKNFEQYLEAYQEEEVTEDRVSEPQFEVSDEDLAALEAQMGDNERNGDDGLSE